MNGEIVPLKIDFDFGTGGDAIYLALLRDKRGDVLVDCGYSGFLPRIEAAVSAHGGRMDALAAVIVTHTTTTTWALWPRSRPNTQM